jgi:hypothetical protein
MKLFKQFLNFYKHSHSNNFSIFEDVILYDGLLPSFLDYPLTPFYMDFRKFFKHSLKKGSLSNLLSLFHFKFQHLVKIDFFKDNSIYHFRNPYRERGRVISYPLDCDFTHFITITFKNPLKGSDFDVLKVVSFNDYINEVSKRGFKRMRDFFRRHYQLELKKELYDMSVADLETLFGFVPSGNDLKEYINQETKRFIDENFKYFKVFEVHKSGVLHIHALVKFPQFFMGWNFQDMIRKVADWFETEKNGIEIDKIYKGKNGSGSVKSYILKYMNKQFQLDNLVCVEREEDNIFVLKTSAFIVNFLSRLVSYSRNISRKRFRPFSDFSLEQSEDRYLATHREVDLIRLDIEKKEYNELKLFVDRFVSLSKRRFDNHLNNQMRVGQSVYLLNEFLEGRYFSIKGISKSLDVIRFNQDYQLLYINASKKFDKILNELEDDLINDDYVDF